MNSNMKAFLAVLAVSEGTKNLGDDGYNVLVGSLPGKPLLFHDYSTHPRLLNRKMNSTAAGRYQILARYYDAYKKTLHLKDFSPSSQDAIAIQMIKEQGAYNDVLQGNITAAIRKCKNIWASLPGAGYGQHENDVGQLLDAYIRNGGT